MRFEASDEESEWEVVCDVNECRESVVSCATVGVFGFLVLWLDPGLCRGLFAESARLGGDVRKGIGRLA